MSVSSILTITVPAETQDLVSLDRVKAELNIADGSADSILEDWIPEESGTIRGHTGRVFGQETLQEVFQLRCTQREILLSRRPIASIISIVECGVTLAAEDYEFDAAAGLLYRLSDGRRCQ